jgi:ABC-type Fe3+ transport system permease subunit
MEYLFYRLWQLLIGKSEEDMPPFGSMMIFSMLMVFNIRTIELLIYHFYNIGYSTKDRDEVILYSLIPIFSVLIFNIFYFFRRRNKIKLKYENESKLKKIIGNIVLFIYGVLSIVIAFIVGNAYPKG